jgi:hypothetical protein
MDRSAPSASSCKNRLLGFPIRAIRVIRGKKVWGSDPGIGVFTTKHAKNTKGACKDLISCGSCLSWWSESGDRGNRS